MVNKQLYNNEEELYQQIMAELEPGAAEYDRLMASGEAPAKKAKVIPLRNRWYAVAACFIGLLIVGGAYMLNTGSEPQIAEVKPTVTPKQVESQIAHAIDNKIRSTSFVEAHDAPKRKTLPKVAKEEEDYVYVCQEIEISPSEENAIDIVVPAPERQRSFDVTCINLLPDAMVEGGDADVMVFCDQIYFNDIQTFY